MLMSEPITGGIGMWSILIGQSGTDTPPLCGRRVESALTKASRENRTIMEWERGSFPKGADETQSSNKHHSTPLNRMPSRQQ